MPLKLALLGLQGHVDTVLKGAQEAGDVEVVAIADESERRIEGFVRARPALAKADRYADWRMLLEHALPDVCCVADENARRADQLVALFGRGVHVVAEKPLTTTLDDLDRVRAAFARSRSKLTMLLELRHQPKNARVRELIRDGAIGEVRQVAAAKSYKWGERPAWFGSRARLGGTIPYIGIHSLDLVRFTTGLEFAEVAAFHGTSAFPATGETESHASVVGLLSNGGSVTVRLDYLRPAAAPTHGDDRLRIIGTKGVLEVNEGDEAVSLVTAEKVERVPFGETAGLFAEFAKFLRGGPVPRIAADDCFASTDLVLRTRDAADGKRVVSIRAPRPVRE